MVDVIRRSLAEIRRRARAELRINPTITIYTMVNGVEKRRAANPFAKINAQINIEIRAAVRRLNRQLIEVAAQFDEFGRQAREAMKGGPL